MTNRGTTIRAVVVAVGLLSILAALGAHLGSLHFGSNDELWNLVSAQQNVQKDYLFGRGRILDRNGHLLAFERPASHVHVSPEDIRRSGKTERVADLLSTSLDMDRSEILTILNRKGRYDDLVKRFVPGPIVDQLATNHIYGLMFKDAHIRVYPYRERMAHVLGFTNWEGVGSAGVEQKLDLYLRGTPGILIGRRDRRARELYQHRQLYIESQEGANVELTLDQNIQLMVEGALEEAVTQHKAKGGWAIVQNVATGEILGMASLPSYDPMNFFGSSDEQLRNQAVSTVYEPGSTLKVLSIATAIEAGAVNEDSVFDCEMGQWYFAGRPLNDHHPYGRLSVADILKKSSNIGTAKVVLEIGAKRLDEGLRSFGLGSTSGILLPGEERGLFSPYTTWSKVRLTRVPMGQGIGVTALQLLNAICAIANDGYLMKPMIVRRIVHRNGQSILEYEPEVLGRPISEKTARVMRRMMERVTDLDGTGRRARVEGYPVAGKTGTAQKPEAGGYSNSKHYASFVGFAPAQDPVIGIVVVVDEPQPIHSGGYVAAPAWKRIAEQALPYLEVPARIADSENPVPSKARG